MATIFDLLSTWSCSNLGPILCGVMLGLALTALVWLALRKNLGLAASGRYLVWWTTLVVVLVLPWAAAWSPSFSDILNRQVTFEKEGILDKSPSDRQILQPSEPETPSVPSNRYPATTPASPEYSMWSSTYFRLTPLLVAGAWLAFVFLNLLKLWHTYRGIVRIKTDSRPFDLGRLPGLKRQIENAARRPVAVRVSSEINTPMAAGLGEATILIPVQVAAELSPDDLEAIILHELAHLTRWDDWTKLAQKLIEAVFFFHPAVHLIGRQLELERELACDEWAVGQFGQVERYACSLTRLVQLTNGGITSLIPGALTGRKQIFKRFERLLLYLPTKSFRHTRIATVGLVMSVLASAFLLTGIAPAITLPIKPLTLAELGASSVDTSQPDGDHESTTTPDTTAPTKKDTSATEPNSPSTPGALTDAGLEQLLATLDLSPEAAIEADWEAEFKRGRPWLNFTFYYDRNSRSSFSLPVDSFVGLDESWRTEQVDDVRFLLIRGAGVFDFRGGFKKGSGDGEFEFRVREDYLRELDSLGYRVSRLDDFDLYQLALFDVSGTFIKEMEDLGYEGLTLERLIQMRIHGVKTETVRELRDLGYDLSADRLIEFQIHGVTPRYIKDLAGTRIENLPAERLVEFRIHGVDPSDVAEFAEVGLVRLSAERLVEFRIHGVTPTFVKSLATLGYDHLRPERLVEFRIHGVTPEMISEFRELGYRNLDAEDLTTFKIHGVTPGFVRELAGLGYKDVYPDDLVSMRIHGVDRSYIERLRDKGFDDLDIDDLIEMRVHGID